MSVRYEIGDVREVIRTIPDGSVSLVASSPPFFKLRSYLPGEHEAKHAEIGSETTPAEFLDTLLQLTAEWGRVLAPWGSLAIELGDTYSGSGGGGGDYLPGGMREGQQQFAGSAASMRESNAAHWRAKAAGRDSYPLPKCLVLIPELYAIALAYGMNPLTGRPSPAGQWLVRNVICWHRPNPAVGALGDKVRPSTSYITVATRSPKRWFDLDAVRTAPANGLRPGQSVGNGLYRGHPDEASSTARPDCVSNAAGAPPLDCWFDQHDTWTLTTQPSRLSHYAMWPARLAERLILMMCPAEACATCGEPRRRLTKPNEWPRRSTDPLINDGGAGVHGDRCATVTTVGWSDCGHGAFVPGTVLDGFAGTGTTLAVADLHGRDAIGIDIDARNRDLYPQRRDECARALFGTRPQLDGQMSLLGEGA